MKIPIFCSLLPTEFLTDLGHELTFITPKDLESARSERYQCILHDNLCSYSKLLYDFFTKNHDKFDIIIIPHSCDATKKLYNGLLAAIPNEKIHFFDAPKNKDHSSAEFLNYELEKLGKRIGKGELTGGNEPTFKNKKETITIGVSGANIPLETLQKCAEKYEIGIYYLNHCLYKSYPDAALTALLKKEGLNEYSKHFLKKNSCPRTNDESYKEKLIQTVTSEKLSGLIFNGLKFCDFIPFDYKYFKENLDIPVMMIETDLTSNFEGQIMTRLEAFFEKIKGVSKKKKRSSSEKGKYFIGVDSGSHFTKLACIDSKKNIIARHLVPTGTSVKASVAKAFEKLEKDGIGKNEIASIVATGYGRNNIDGADRIITEISCHAAGVHHILNKKGTIIDIGGQDSKAIKIDEHGKVIQFAMNDKCAAGTGRFLEVMADKLQMSLEQFAELALSARSHVPISSMCSVFAESEVISLIAAGISKSDIARGIHKSIAERTVSLSKRINGEPPYFMTGGVAKNASLISELEDTLGSKLQIIDQPQFAGALGAAIYALEGE